MGLPVGRITEVTTGDLYGSGSYLIILVLMRGADLAQLLLEEGKPLPIPNSDASAPEADLIELLPLSVEAGSYEVVKQHELLDHPGSKIRFQPTSTNRRLLT